jgi:hypothetical protein
MLVRWQTVIRLTENQVAGYQDSRISGDQEEKKMGIEKDRQVVSPPKDSGSSIVN